MKIFYENEKNMLNKSIIFFMKNIKKLISNK